MCCVCFRHPQSVEDDFVDMRKDDPESVSAEDLHRLLVVARFSLFPISLPLSLSESLNGAPLSAGCCP